MKFLSSSAFSLVDVEWDALPLGLRQDIDRYLEGLTRIRRSRTGQRIRPLNPSTIRTRRAELQAAARMAAKNGVPIDKLDSLSALLAQAVVEKVLDAYWRFIPNIDIDRLRVIDENKFWSLFFYRELRDLHSDGPEAQNGKAEK